MAIEVADDPAQLRYTATVDGAVAGFVTYQRHGATVTLKHTEVESAFEGQGVGSALAKGALDDLRARDLRVVPECAFIRSYIKRHADYGDVVDGSAAG